MVGLSIESTDERNVKCSKGKVAGLTQLSIGYLTKSIGCCIA